MKFKYIAVVTILFSVSNLFFQNFSQVSNIDGFKTSNPNPLNLAYFNESKLEHHRTQMLIKFAPSKIREVENQISSDKLEYSPQKRQAGSNFLAKHKLNKMRPVFRSKIREKKMTGLSELELAKRFSFKSKVRHYQPEEFKNEDLSSYYVVDVDTSVQSLPEALVKLRQDPDIVTVELMPMAKLFFTLTDPLAFTSYDFGFARLMEASWDYLLETATRAGQGQIVAVIDSGVDATHPDIAANVLPGWNTITNTNASDDDNGHGTHVAGTIAAVNNNIGIIGLAHAAKVLPIKAMDSEGNGSLADIVEGIIYATDNGADVINMSLGIQVSCSQLLTLKRAVDYAINRGVVIVAAAGNSALEVSNFSPASCDNVIVVSASNKFDQIAAFSNFGTRIDVAAPGVDIISLRAAKSKFSQYIPGYSKLSGTSMAAPHVAGLAAEILSRRPSLSPIFIRNLIRNTAKDIAAAGFDIAAGNGRIDPIKAVSTKSKKFDYNGDLYSDFLGLDRTKPSDNFIWLSADNSTPLRNYSYSSVGSGISAIGDFNNDGISDLWNPTGFRFGPFFNLGSSVSVSFDVDWKAVGTTDLDGDGASEVLLRNSITGENKYWKLSSSGLQSVITLATLSNVNWEPVALSDFDGNNKTDIFWRNRKTGENMIWIDGNSNLVRALPIKDLSWTVVGSGNFYYTSDIIWKDSSTNNYVLWIYGGLWQQPTSIDVALNFAPTAEWQAQVIADFKPNPKDEIFFRNLVTGENKIYKIDSRSSISADFYFLNAVVNLSTRFSHPTILQPIYGPSTTTPFSTKLIKTSSYLVSETENICGYWDLVKCSSTTNTDLISCPEGQYISKYFFTNSCARYPATATPYCPSVRMTIEIRNSDGSDAECEGTLPAVIGRTNGVLGVNDAGVRAAGMTGAYCKSGNVNGTFYNSLYSPAIGKCKSSCTLIGDCAANGKWKNIRHIQ